jgi:hypothetical protein
VCFKMRRISSKNFALHRRYGHIPSHSPWLLRVVFWKHETKTYFGRTLLSPTDIV